MNFESPSERVIKKIGSLKKPGGCGASLGRAMYMTRRRLVPTMRKNSNKAMFIISTGTLNMGTSHPRAARLLESEQSFQVFSIAIGKNPNKRVLSTVASQPEKSHLIFLRYYGDVFDAVRRTVTLKQRGETLCVFFATVTTTFRPPPPFHCVTVNVLKKKYFAMQSNIHVPLGGPFFLIWVSGQMQM